MVTMSLYNVNDKSINQPQAWTSIAITSKTFASRHNTTRVYFENSTYSHLQKDKST